MSILKVNPDAINSQGSFTFGNVSTTANLTVGGVTSVSGNILPTLDVQYSIGAPDKRFKDLYLSGNTLYLGNSTFSTENIFPFDLGIQPEVLSIQVQANQAGDAVQWQWTWVQSTLPYARATITNQFQASVPLYKDGTYQVDNYAGYEVFGTMTQAHLGYFKWVEGAGTQNLVSWASTYTTANVSHPDINGGNITQVQRYNINVPSSITVPNLTAPTINYNVSVSNGQFYFGGDAGMGYNVNLGPVYRGGTYTFNLDASLANHPFYLTTDNGTNFVANAYVGEYTTGVTGSRNNGSTSQTTLVFQVPQNAPSTLYYQCGVHASMRGALTIKDLAVETNVNGNYVIHFQHTHEGHSTPIEIRPIPALVNQMCLVYDQTQGRFVPQDMATYVENTPSFKNKIREVAGTATLIAPNGVAVVPTVLVVEDASYLPLVDNKEGDIAFDSYYDTLYVWQGNAWRSTKPAITTGYTGSAGAGYTGSVGYTGSAGTNGYTGSIGSLGYTGSIGYSGSIGYTGSKGSGAITTGNTAPVSPSEGDLWYRSSNDVLYRYLNLGSAYSWVDMTGPVYNFGVSDTDFALIQDSASPIGQVEYTTAGTYSWTAPAYVTKVCVVCVGGGGGGGQNSTGGAKGGGGGGLGWKNNITVVPGQSYTVVVGAGGAGSNGGQGYPNPGNPGGDSYFISATLVKGGGGGAGLGGAGTVNGGGYVGDGGGNGGNAGSNGSVWGGAGGAGGYTGNGGNGANQVSGSASAGSAGSGGGAGGGSSTWMSAGLAGGGVGIYGQGANGAGGNGTDGGQGGSGGTQGNNQGGAFGGGGATNTYGASYAGGGGAVRIIWGYGRAFPSTGTANQ